MIHNHEVRSSILRPATRKRHHRIFCDVFFVYPYYIVILNEADFVILNGAEGEVKDLEHQILRDHREKYVFLTLLPRTD